MIRRIGRALGLGAVVLGVTAGGTLFAASTASAAPSYDCPGGTFCGYDGRDGTGAMIVQKDSSCVLHDIGNAGVGDRLTSYWNRTGTTVGVYNWTGDYWQLLATIADNQQGNLPASVDNMADAVQMCI